MNILVDSFIYFMIVVFELTWYLDASTLVYVTVGKAAKRNSNQNSKSPSKSGNSKHPKSHRPSPEIGKSTSSPKRRDPMLMTNSIFEQQPAFIPPAIKPDEQFTDFYTYLTPSTPFQPPIFNPHDIVMQTSQPQFPPC